MKLRNILFSLAIMFIGITSVNASDNILSYFDVNSKDLYQINSSKYLSGSSISIAYKKNANGDIIYCTERPKSSVHSGTMRYNLSKELGANYAYIMENGYPNRSIFGDNEKDYFTTSLAIWYLVNPSDSVFTYFDLNNGTYRGKESDVVREMARLVFDSRTAKYEEPSITINNSKLDLNLSSDGKYYVSSNISASSVGISKYSVSFINAPSGTIVTDVNGNNKNIFKYNESFIVKVPASSVDSLSSNFKVKVSASGTIYKAFEYMPTDSKYQGTAALYSEAKNVSDSISLNITKNPEIVISKKDITTGNELPGASLELRNEKGELIYAWVSTEEAFVIKDGLTPGKYTLTEVIAPEGYELNKETVTFTVNDDGTVDGKIVMYNKPETIIEVPSTSSFKTMTTSLIGLLIISLGSLIIYKKYKKNEEK